MSRQHRKWCHLFVDNCVWSDCGDGFVVYHRPSGKTHFLNEAGKCLLTEILRTPKDLQSIAAELRPEQGHESAEKLQEQLIGTLRRFEQLGLIQSV